MLSYGLGPVVGIVANSEVEFSGWHGDELMI